jgi:hypothetical protein
VSTTPKPRKRPQFTPDATFCRVPLTSAPGRAMVAWMRAENGKLTVDESRALVPVGRGDGAPDHQDIEALWPGWQRILPSSRTSTDSPTSESGVAQA